MPKTANGLWAQIIDWDNLQRAAKATAKKKWSFPEVLRFNNELEHNLLTIKRELIRHTWRPGRFREFVKLEPKPRSIAAPCYKDRVIHHALVQVVGPLFEAKFFSQSHACRIGKGQHKASDYLMHMLSSAQNIFGSRFYVLKCDVTKYFDNVDHEILMQIIGRTIRDKNTLWLIRQQVTGCEVFPHGRGIPKGCLTSQIFANIYLDQLDHYIKDELSIRHYVRFMDDFVILAGTKDELKTLLERIRTWLAEHLKLTLNQKTQIFPGRYLVDFAGYRHKPGYKLPRKRNLRRAAKKFKGLSRCYERGDVELEIVRSCVASFIGYIKHCKGWRSARSALSNLVLRPPKGA